MKNLYHLIPVSLSLVLLFGGFVQAEEAVEPATTDSSSEEVMEAVPTMANTPTLTESDVFDTGLALGRRLRVSRRDCAPLRRESIVKWNACRKENIDMRGAVLKMRREVRGMEAQDFKKERAEGSQSVKKPMRKNFIEFNKKFRNYYIEDSSGFDMLNDKVKARRESWQEQRQQTGDVNARSRMLERMIQKMGPDSEELGE